MRLSRLVGLVLGGGCALLALVGALLIAGTGGPIRPSADSVAAQAERPGAALEPLEPFSLAEEEAYAEIAARPLFNEDRRPAPEAEELAIEEEDPAAEEEELPPAPLAVAVRGIIISPDLKLAIVTDPKTNTTLRLEEGMPLEGEMAAWTLSEIQPRKLVFDGQSASEAEVELEVHKAALAGGAPAQPRAAQPATPVQPAASPAAQQAEEQAQAATDAEARAEEIRRRVAERRAQLRAEAERRRQQQQDNDN